MLRSIVTLSILLTCSATIVAGPLPLDLVPADATVAIAIPNLTKLQDKGDKLVADSGANIPRLSNLFQQLFNGLGVNAGLDPDQSMAIMLARRDPKKDGPINLDDLVQLIVVVIPFKDRDQMAGNFGFKAGELKPDETKPGELNQAGNFKVFFRTRDSHLFISPNEQSLLSVVKGKPIRGELDATRQKQLDQADLIAHLAIPAVQREWKELLGALEQKIQPTDAAEKEVLREFIRSAESFRFLLASVRLDDGIAFSTTVVLPKEARESAKKLAALLGTARDRTGLRGLPEGNVVAAQSYMTDGSRNAFLIRSVLAFLLNGSGSFDIGPVFTAADRLNYMNIFTDVWQRLQGSRVAMYQTPSEFQLGLFSFVAILDTEKPDQLMAELKELAKLADAKFLEEQPADKRQALIEKLVGDLGSNDFQVRHSATTRLALLGEAVLPFLEKVAKSNDLEIRQRADRLWAELSKSVEERRKQLLSGELPKLAPPSFAFLPMAEKRDGQEVHVIRAKLQEQDALLVPKLKHLLGPDWDKIRLAVHGKQVVVLLGSDVSLLDATLNNLRENKPGLAGSESVTTFSKYSDPARALELHVSAQRAVAVTNPEANARKKIVPGLSSFALTIDAEYLRLDLWVPAAEFGAIAGQR